jgi:hypothetical protein
MLVVTAALQGAVAFASARVGRVALATAMVGMLGMGSMGPVQAQVGVSAGGVPGYSMGIKVPPGVAGMSPNLGLSFSGGGINGPVGLGWSVQGISVITRCGGITPSDGKPIAVTYTASDKLCLDGQRLIRADATGAPVAANAAANGALSDAQGQTDPGYIEYRTEKDSYARKLDDAKGFRFLLKLNESARVQGEHIARIWFAGSPAKRNGPPRLGPVKEESHE